MPVYSHSSLGVYENCPLQYKFRYIERIKPEEEVESVEAFLGSRVHEALRRLYELVLMEKVPTVEELLVFFDSIWERNWNDTIEIADQSLTSEDYRNVGRRCLSDYYRRYHPFNQERTIGLERRITIVLDKEGRYRMQGCLDRLAERDGIYEIHDYKTSGFLPDSDRFDADRQLALYQIGVQEAFRNAEDIELVWHYLRFDKEIRSRRSQEELDEIRKQTIALIQEIEKSRKLDNFPPNESRLCDWCDYQSICQSRKHYYQTRQLTVQEFSKEYGANLVNRYAEAKIKEREVQEEIEKIRDELIRYAEEKGIDIIYGKDRKAKIRTYPWISFSDEEKTSLEDILKGAGKWDDVSMLDLRRLNKIILEAPQGWSDIVERIKDLGIREKRYELRLSRLRED